MQLKPGKPSWLLALLLLKSIYCAKNCWMQISFLKSNVFFFAKISCIEKALAYYVAPVIAKISRKYFFPPLIAIPRFNISDPLDWPSGRAAGHGDGMNPTF
jgi:hypothetical protein